MKMTIGEFSKLAGVTVKALRHYEKIGLVTPSYIDSLTGYRHYRLEQLQRIDAILRLKSLGFSLDEIRSLYRKKSHEPDIGVLDEKIRKCEEEIARLVEMKSKLESLAAFRKEVDTMNKNITIEKLPAITVASHRAIIPSYESLGELCVNVIGPEMFRLGCKCAEPGYCFTFEHCKEYKPADIDIEYCEQVMEKGTDSDIIQFKDIPEIPKAICMKCFGPYSKLRDHYREVFRYIEENGYKVSGAPRASYVDGIWNQEDPEKWLTIIQVPVSES